MTTVFISYRGADAQPAEQLAQAIRDAGHGVFFAEWDIGLGDSIVGRIDAGLAGARALVLCLSSSGTSDWVDREWMSALMRQLGDRSIKLLPVRLTGGSLPAILADVKFADLAADWAKGQSQVLKALERLA